MEITLYRHAKPIVRGGEKIWGAQFGDWLRCYQESDIEDPPSREIRYTRVVCSPLLRSRATAFWMGDQVEVKAILREAELPRLVLPNVRLPASVWVVLARMLWCLGCAHGCESRREFKERVEEVSQWIESQSEPVVIVGHGWLNRALVKKLSKRWRVVESTGHGYLGYSKLRRVS